jgi:hypothetical protein
LKAPNTAGDFPIGLEISDVLNNKLNKQNKASVNVAAALSKMELVKNLSAEAYDRRVVLNWDNPLNLDDVEFFRIYYGTSPESLVNAVDTFTSSNTWYIPNLQNGLTYYFQMEAIGVNGDKSPGLSNIVSATPILNLVDIESPDVLHGVAGADVLATLDSDVSNTGPGLNVILGLGLIFISLFNFRDKIRTILTFK